MTGAGVPPSDLTHGQLLIWTGQRLHPAAPLYNMILAFDFAGAIDPLHFTRAWNAVLERSDALRAVFEETEAGPRQRLRAASVDPLEVVDLSAEPDPGAAAREWMSARATRLFDLRERAFDGALLRLAGDRCIWYLNQHHLVTDGWSAALVYRQVAELYGRSVQGTLADAPSVPLYAAYVEYERRFRASAMFGRVREHWERKLAAPIEPIRLYGRAPSRVSTQTERVTRELDGPLAVRVRELAAAAGRSLTPHASLFNVFAAALFAYLQRVSGQRRLAIGTPSHNRPTAAFKETIGLFIEVLPYVVDVQDSDSLRTLLAKVQTETAEFLRYAQPGTSSPQVNRSFSVLLNYIHASFPPFHGMPMRSEWIHPGHGDSAHHLRLQVHDFDVAGRFVLHFDFNAYLLDGDEREAAADQFVRMLRALLENADREIADVDLLSTEEGRRVIERHVPALARAVPGRTVVEMFAAQAERSPDAVAVQEGDAALSYGELRRRVDRLAARLRASGVGPEVLVGLYLERSLDAVVAVLAVLAAGGAYVPVSPADPALRVEMVLRDAGVRVLLTRRGLHAALPHAPASVLYVDVDDAPAAAPTDVAHGRSRAPSPGNAAYVLYTSGSTGRPRGVVVEHRSLANYVGWASEFYLRGEPLDFPLFTSLSFDLTVTSLFVPLVSGGRVVVYGESEGVPPLLRVLEDDRVDVIKLTPSHLALLRAAPVARRRVRKLILGGEDLRVERALSARAALGDVEIYNEYGPTEATVGCMIHRFDPEREGAASVPIGVAAAGATIHVLDAALRPVPDGVIGEIWIGGPGLARGYLGDAERTAERFRDDPFQPGARLYRSGDLGRWRSDGLLQFLGRADGQLKVQGARVEPAEVESALLEHPAIEACVVDGVRVSGRTSAAALVHCTLCGLPSNYPGVNYDAAGVCHLCRGFESYRERASRYFRTMDDLRDVIDAARSRRRGAYDCVLLLSGGKDSTYALCRLVEMGVSVFAFTLDNGYISEQAKANIRRVTDALGVAHVFATTPAMNAIFVDSLRRYSNVCNGCFKTIYTLGARLAREQGIPLVVTGLSRGQFFETRLSEELFRGQALDVERIDRVVLEARKAYHRVPDGVATLLDTRDFRDDALFEDVQFVDFYRYCDVGLDEMLGFLDRHAPWIRPSDTGRSTNCLINQVGIYVHREERGFHNYAFPYSWDVRMGHKTRAAALQELNDDIDPVAVQAILHDIGYEPAAPAQEAPELRLVAWYVAPTALPTAELREHLARRLPAAMIPAHFVHLDRLPLTPHGKVDRAALPRPGTAAPVTQAVRVAPRDAAEERIAGIWAEVLEVERVGVMDEFLDIGGNSLLAIRIISRVNQAFAVDLPLRSAFEATTVAALARLVEEALLAQVETLSEEEAQRIAVRAT